MSSSSQPRLRLETRYKAPPFSAKGKGLLTLGVVGIAMAPLKSISDHATAIEGTAPTGGDAPGLAEQRAEQVARFKEGAANAEFVTIPAFYSFPSASPFSPLSLRPCASPDPRAPFGQTHRRPARSTCPSARRSTGRSRAARSTLPRRTRSLPPRSTRTTSRRTSVKTLTYFDSLLLLSVSNA